MSDHRELERAADQLLWTHADHERCRSCAAPGRLTGASVVMIVVDAFGFDTGLRAVAPVYECPDGHTWHKGEGRKMGLEGILFDQQLRYRRRREMGVDVATLEVMATEDANPL